VLTLNTLGDIQRNYHEVVDCGEHVMKESSLMDQNFLNTEILVLNSKQEITFDIHNSVLRIRIRIGLGCSIRNRIQIAPNRWKGKYLENLVLSYVFVFYSRELLQLIKF
jgi:hypothetical protein